MEKEVLIDQRDISNEEMIPYVLNKGLPRFVGRTEIRRLSKVIDEKNALIEKFKKYDEERKAYYAERMEEYQEMQESFNQFMQELMKVVEDGELDQSEQKKFLKLYTNWFKYKNNAELYKDKLASARQSVRDIRDDFKKFEEMVSRMEFGSTTEIEQVISRIYTMRKHLDTLQSKMIL